LLTDPIPILTLRTYVSSDCVPSDSGVLNSSKANKSESIFGTRYGKQAGDGFKPNGAYAAEIPYAVNGEIILPSKLRQRKQEEARRARMVKAKSLKSLLDPSMMVAEANKVRNT
jgi:hypothetical protein